MTRRPRDLMSERSYDAQALTSVAQLKQRRVHLGRLVGLIGLN